jgi:hypothetical protein
MGQQPVQQMSPQQTGVKALYWRQQMTLVHLPQQQWWNSQAEAGAVAAPRTATLNRPKASSFFMVGAIFS